LNKLIRFNQENPELLTAIGSIYLKLGNSDEAFKFFKNAMNYDTSYGNVIKKILKKFKK